MSEMVERVAIAIRESFKSQMKGGPIPGDASPESWASSGDGGVIDCVAVASAVFAALREPTKAMMPAGLEGIRFNMDVDRDSYETRDIPTEATAYHCWVEMIDAALKD